ncbi:MAG TPA: DUF1697 domain-containing protein [Gaiellaceae bacterium]|jgi:uncharacterized protein (DUF1697 family)|nr:DUF1697 domain-containing protein [Gaiellaceae bacterium]
MARQVALLRGVNVGSHNRISMPALRDRLGDAGFDDVVTYLQSGNVVLSSTLKPAALEAECRGVIADAFGLDVDVLVRTGAQLATIVRKNPLGRVATDAKRYQVTFLSKPPPTEVVRKLEALAAGGEQLAASGRELYAWHPNGIGRSKLAARMTGKDLGAVATSRNWATVTTLLELAS